MSEYQIIEHSAKLPHKQAFRVVLRGRISRPDLLALTERIARIHRIGEEAIFFNWWLASQDLSTEECWAHSKMVDGEVSAGTNLLSFEEFHEAVETRPLRVDSEIGLWHRDLGSRSHYIHLTAAEAGKVEVRKSFLDGSGGTELLTIVTDSPLRLKDSDDGYLQVEEDGLVIGDDDGSVIVPRVR